MISVHLRWFLLGKEGLENHDLADAHNHNAESDKDRPDHHSFVEIFRSFSSLKKRVKSEVDLDNILIKHYLSLAQSVMCLIINDAIQIFVNFLRRSFQL